MSDREVDPLILKAWLSARSIARGLPPPTAEYGGFCVDTGTDAELRRWVFPKVGAGLTALAHSIREPRVFLKLCGEAGELRAALPERWQLHPSSYFMRSGGAPSGLALHEGYRIETRRTGGVSEVRVLTEAGELAASGYAAETADAFVYDRIVAQPAHRRRGLGRSVMMALHQAKVRPATPELLVATQEGRALYATLGWQVVSPYSTASISDAGSGLAGRPA